MKEIPVKQFREILRAFERELNIQNQSSCCCGVTITQCHALMNLDKKDDITLNELSDSLNLDKSTVSRTVEGLVRMGWVSRIIPDNNRRTTRISLSDEGRKICDTINSGNDFYYRQVLSDIPENLQNKFLEGLSALTMSMAEQNKTT